MTHDLRTPAEIVQKVRDEMRRLKAERKNAASYNGPDPNPDRSREIEARLVAMQDVMIWIEDAEIAAASAAAVKALQL